MPTPSLLTSFQELLAVLGEARIPHTADAERQLLEAPVSMPPLEGRLIMRWEKDLPYLQILLVMLKDVPGDRFQEIESACCRANTAVALPGFGIDHELGIIYFRLTLPTIDGIFANTVQRMVMTVATNAREFVAAFRDVLAGKPGESIIELAVAWAQADAAARQPA